MRTRETHPSAVVPADAAAGTRPDHELPPNTRLAPDAAVPCGARRPGRPRSDKAVQAILDAAIEAVGERGIDGVSCEDVAARAGVGKATLYRRWTGKEDLLIAAFAALRRPLPAPCGESVRSDLIAMEIAAAERELALTARPQPTAEQNSQAIYLERSVASPGGAIESIEG